MCNSKIIAIDNFVEKLSINSANFENVENMYAKYEIQKNNLKLYLKQMFNLNPNFLIVGEAPGYKGCRWSGIPFTSEKIIVSNSFFGLDKGYKVRNEKQAETEASATIVWEFLNSKKLKPLIWNAFPYHPYRNGNINSNRTPSYNELEFGREILYELINIFEIDKNNIIAIGNSAGKILYDLFEIENKVRHPARGGKSDFITGLEEYIK